MQIDGTLGEQARQTKEEQVPSVSFITDHPTNSLLSLSFSIVVKSRRGALSNEKPFPGL